MHDLDRQPLELHVDEPIADGRFLILDDRDDTATAAAIARPVGQGATAQVYRCRQRLGQAFTVRAVKFLNPTVEVATKRAEANLTAGHSAFLTEILNLSELNHQNLVRIIDAGTHKGIEFFVMDYVHGPTFENLCNKESLVGAEWRDRAVEDSFELVRMVRQVCWALSYLHERGYFHMDVAPKNVFLSKVDGRPHVVLGDLGVAKRLSGIGIDDEQTVVVAGTKKYCPPSAHSIRGKLVSIAELRKHSAAWDCFSVGQLLLDLLSLAPKDSGTHTFSLLANQILRHPERYTASSIASELTRLMPEQLTTAGVNELSATSIGSTTSISIPLYDVPISRRIAAVFDHPTFSRLRLIPQLLLVRTVYPGAQHTRFEHALGSYELARRVLLQLISEPEFLIEFKAQEIEEALVAVILVHLSVFQLHHVFEEALDEDELRLRKKDGAICSVVEWFLDLEHVTKDVQVRSGAEDNTQMVPANRTLRQTIEKHFPRVNLADVLGVLHRRPLDGLSPSTRPSLRIATSLVRSSLDVRVMDYLVRDAHHAGVDSGTNVDIDHIIRCLRVLRDPLQLAVTKQGVHAVENLLCARYWMYSRVYWNDLNRSMFAMLRFAVIRLVDVEAITLDSYVEATIMHDERGALQYLRDRCRDKHGLQRVVEIIDCLLLPRPRPFRTLLEITQHNEGTPAQLIDVYRQRTARDLKLVYDVIGESLKYELDLDCSTGDILIDVPRDRLDKLGAEVNILINGKPRTLVSSSKIVESLPEAFKTSAVKLRVFWSHKFRKSVELKGIKSSLVQEVITRSLSTCL